MYETEIVEASPVVDSSMLAMQHKSEIEAMVDTAHKYPRSLRNFEADAITMATIDEETAQAMFYTLKRGNKPIVGPSVRLAEIAAVAWGNLRYGSRIVATDDKFITAQGFCFDAQKNTGVTVEIQRRITNKDGVRYNDDMIQVTGNAASSIALRNAIIRVIPRVYIDKIFKASQDVALGKGQSMESRRARAIETIMKFGVSEARILSAIGKPSVKDIDIEDLTVMFGLTQAVKSGEKTLEEAFPEEAAETPATTPAKPSSKGAAQKTREALGPKPTPLTVPPMESEEWLTKYSQFSDQAQSEYDQRLKDAMLEGISRDDAHARIAVDYLN